MSTNNEIIKQCIYKMIENLLWQMMSSLSLSRYTCIDPYDIARIDTDFLNKINATVVCHPIALQ